MRFSFRQRLMSFIRLCLIKAKRTQVRFGRNVYIGRNATISGIYDLKIGSNIYIGKNVTLEFEGEIGDGVIIANNVGIVGRNDHEASDPLVPMFSAKTVREKRELSLYTSVGRGCWIGYGAIVLSGVQIGEHCIVAAGAVVIADVPPFSIVGGNPARVVRLRNRSVKGAEVC